MDATNFRDRLTAIVPSVRYRGGAIPVAWEIRAAATGDAWMPRFLTLLAHSPPP